MTTDFDVPWVFGQVVTTLGQLPRNANGIAEHLFALGHRGVRGSRSGCALGDYVRSKVDAAKHGVSVELDAGAVYVSKDGFELNWRFPPHVAWFVNAYDRGHYPDLIKAGEHLPNPAAALEGDCS